MDLLPFTISFIFLGEHRHFSANRVWFKTISLIKISFNTWPGCIGLGFSIILFFVMGIRLGAVSIYRDVVILPDFPSGLRAADRRGPSSTLALSTSRIRHS